MSKEDKAMGIGGDGGSGDVSEGQAFTEGAALVGGSGLGTAIGADASLSGGSAAQESPGGIYGGPGADQSRPVVSQVSTQTPEVVQPSIKVDEQKEAVTRKARRRSLLGGEEGGLEPTNIYRRSILGS